jgi:hypothetical protein
MINIEQHGNNDDNIAEQHGNDDDNPQLCASRTLG